MIRRLLKALSSLKLTVSVLVCLFVLVFTMTLDQVNLGIWAAKKKYFESWWVIQDIGGFPLPIMPGGQLLGWLLAMSLIIVPFYRFKWKRDKWGIWFIHFGLIILISGSFLIQKTAIESQMIIAEGQKKAYTESRDQSEWVVEHAVSSTQNRGVAFDGELLASKKINKIPLDSVYPNDTPFQINVLHYYPNSEVRIATGVHPIITKGQGRRLSVRSIPLDGTINGGNQPSAIIEAYSDNKSLGIWMVSYYINRPQYIDYKGTKYAIQLRPKRYEHPFQVQLIDFRHDRYPGTNIPKNFSSDVQIISDDGSEFKYKIYMNNPLRYGGLTFYQASFAENETVSVFQVVKNAVWWFPYLASAIITLGIFLQLLVMIPKRKPL